MVEKKCRKHLEDGMLALKREAQAGPIPIRRILHLLPGKGQALTLILLSIPFCQPLQIPGLSTPFGLAAAFVGLRMVFGKQAWLPQKILDRNISGRTVQKVANKALHWIRKIAPWIHSRWNWVCDSFAMQLINGLFICVLGLFLALPLPVPLSNIAAAWPLFLIGLGLLEDDGLFVIAGYGIALLFSLIFFFTVDLAYFH